MAWCHQATSHYLSQCWPISMSPYGVIRPQWAHWRPTNHVPVEIFSCLPFVEVVGLGAMLASGSGRDREFSRLIPWRVPADCRLIPGVCNVTPEGKEDTAVPNPGLPSCSWSCVPNPGLPSCDCSVTPAGSTPVRATVCTPEEVGMTSSVPASGWVKVGAIAKVTIPDKFWSAVSTLTTALLAGVVPVVATKLPWATSCAMRLLLRSAIPSEERLTASPATATMGSHPQCLCPCFESWSLKAGGLWVPHDIESPMIVLNKMLQVFVSHFNLMHNQLNDGDSVNVTIDCNFFVVVQQWLISWI